MKRRHWSLFAAPGQQDDRSLLRDCTTQAAATNSRDITHRLEHYGAHQPMSFNWRNCANEKSYQSAYRHYIDGKELAHGGTSQNADE
jgi:hypothetical protein